MHFGINLRVSARRVAVWLRRGNLVTSGLPQMGYSRLKNDGENDGNRFAFERHRNVGSKT
jgi:hypothetical protein